MCVLLFVYVCLCVRISICQLQPQATANSFRMLFEIFKDDIRFQHYAHVLANPINAAQNPASSKKAKLIAMYSIRNPAVEG